MERAGTCRTGTDKWIIGRTQLNSKADGDKVVIPLQKQYKLTPLSAWGKPYTPAAAKPDPKATKKTPNEILEAMPIDEFFNLMNRFMTENPPPAADAPVLKKLAKIGVGPGKKFDLASLPHEEQEAVKTTPQRMIPAA